MSLQTPVTHDIEAALQWATGLLRETPLTEDYALGPDAISVFSGEGRGRELVVLERQVPGGQRASLDGLRHLVFLVRLSCPESQGHPVNWHQQCHALATEALAGAEYPASILTCRMTRLPSTPFANGGRLHSTAAYQLDLTSS